MAEIELEIVAENKRLRKLNRELSGKLGKLQLELSTVHLRYEHERTSLLQTIAIVSDLDDKRCIVVDGTLELTE